MGECAGTDNRFVCRDRHVADLADGLAGAPDFVVIDAGLHIHDVFTHFDRHDHFFQRTVTGALTDAVHCPFYLTCASMDGCNCIANGQAQIVVSVDGNNRFIDIRYAFVQAGNDVGELERHGVADGVRDIDGGGTGVNRGFNHACQIGDWRTTGIFTGEFNVVGVVASPFDHVNRTLNNFIQRATQFCGDMHRGGGDKSMDSECFGHFQRFCCHVDIFFYAASQSTYAAIFDGAGDGLHGLEVTR
ncbi:hypothetical protein D3C75_344780 [compost metagenome]